MFFFNILSLNLNYKIINEGTKKINCIMQNKKEEIMDKKIGFIGCGNMAAAMITGLVKNGIKGSSIIASNPSREKLDRLNKLYGINITDNNIEAADSDITFLSVKPDKYPSVIKEIKNFIKNETIVVSIAPSVSLSFLQDKLGKEVKLVRAMPNTPALVGMGITAICPNSLLNEEDIKFIEFIFSSFGEYEYVKEQLFPAVVGIAGSSPAYVYMFIEALADGGVYAGLPRDKALKLAASAVLGSAAMVLKTDEHPGLLKDKVCSPGGTTIEAVRALEKNNFRYSVMEAVIKAYEKSTKMS